MSAEGESHGGGFLRAAPAPREALWLGLILAIASCLPFLAAAQPPMTDYASHMARWHVMLDQGRSPFLTQYYGFDWRWTGNLGADLLVIPLAKLFGLEMAGRIIGAIIPPLTGFGILSVEWVLRRRIGVGSLLAFALIWSPALTMGFYNFCLALALALFAFALWVKLEGRRWRWLLFLPIGLIVWVCHLAGWGVLGVLVFGYEAHRRRNLSALLAPWPLTLPVAPLLFGGGTKGMLSFGSHVLTYKVAIFLQTMRDQLHWLDLLSLFALLVALLVAMRRKAMDGRLAFAALLLALLAMVLPRHLGGGDYADFRLIPVALLAGCLAICGPGPRWTLWLAALFFAGRLAVTTQAWHRDGREIEEMLAALDHVPHGAKVAGAVLSRRSDWKLNPFGHLPSYATVRRDALTNSHFALPHVHMLSLRGRGAEFADPSQRLLLASGKPIDLAAFAPARGMDYLWYIGEDAPATLPPGARIAFRTPDSLLLHLAKPRGQR